MENTKEYRNKDMISDKDFNRAVAERNSTRPEDDSRGDSAINRHLEIDLGKRHSEVSLNTLKEIEEEDEGHIKADTQTGMGADIQKIQGEISDQGHEGTSSTWPDAGDFTG